MANPIVLAVMVAFMDGKPVDMTILSHEPSMEICQQMSQAAAERSIMKVPKNIEIVIKCYDFSSAPIAAAWFGHKQDD